MLVTPVARELPRAVPLYFRGNPADSSNPSRCPETRGLTLQGSLSPAMASREQSGQHGTPGFAGGSAQLGPIPPLGQWHWPRGEKADVGVSC